MRRVLRAGLVLLACVALGLPAFAQQVISLDISTARADIDPLTGAPMLTIELTAEGQAVFAEFTARHIGKVADLLIDGAVVSSPVVQTVINSPSLVISGDFTMQEVTELARQLNSDAADVSVRGPPKTKIK